VCFGVFGFFWGTWGALLPALKAQTGSTEAELGFALLALAAAALPAMLSSGWIADRFGDRALAPTVGAFGIAALLPGLTHSTLMLAGTLVLLGAASGALDVAMNASVAAEEQRGRRRLMHGAHAVFSGGLAVAAASAGVARSAGGSAIVILGVVSGVVVVVAVSIHFSRREMGPQEASPTARTGAGHLMLSASLLGLGGLCAVAFLVENALESWSALHLEDSLGAGPAVSGLGPAFFALAAALGRLGAQRAAARAPDRALLVVAAGMSAAGTAYVAVAPSPAIALAGVFLAGAGISVAAPTIFSMAGRVVADGNRGRAISTVTTTAYLGFLLGPPLVGAIAGALTLRWAFGVVAAIALVLAIVSRYVPLPGSRPGIGRTMPRSSRGPDVLQ
jgi:predicted MFS family arabinose efflux permease